MSAKRIGQLPPVAPGRRTPPHPARGVKPGQAGAKCITVFKLTQGIAEPTAYRLKCLPPQKFLYYLNKGQIKHSKLYGYVFISNGGES